MIKGKLMALLIFMLPLCLLVNMFCISNVYADSVEEYLNRVAQYHETIWNTNAWGGVQTIGRWGPDWGVGEQGFKYEYRDPTMGIYINYSSEGMGVGMGGIFAGYGGRYSPMSSAAYGPYWMGGSLDVSSTPGYDTQGYMSGSTWGPNTSYYRSQPNLAYSLISGIFNMFGYGSGFGYGGGWYGGGAGYGYPWAAAQGNYPTRLY
ncbi:hypothetical protein JXL19_01690 [bacterium]|nr:hypothetical protein [bacterium]